MANNSSIEFRELSKGDLAISSASEVINQLQQQVDKNKNVSMREFAKVLIWAANIRKIEFAEYMEKERKLGTKFEDHKWCGMPYSEFKVPSLGIY